ncbi:hypothetical protein [Rossellomorea aquimaris]|uniref:Uncharacterized protein n=1 Tax=Rossellomorea aquimaris TaxID=189382 RepID=A0A5D4TX52_9BACI|nr:hypothetical protein [Rossellomorea aquimaris]TYS75000.1 hypothetical protein FZD05_21650 [Rossellomorea aquimaris]TYS79462.1 hypothetical protein FZC85_21570 [Rossellomorea aquimaris]
MWRGKWWKRVREGWRSLSNCVVTVGFCWEAEWGGDAWESEVDNIFRKSIIYSPISIIKSSRSIIKFEDEKKTYKKLLVTGRWRWI